MLDARDAESGRRGMTRARAMPWCASMSLDRDEQRFELLADLGAMIAGRGRARRPARDVRRARRARARRRSRDAVADRRRDRRDPLARRRRCPSCRSCACRSGHGVVGHVAQTGELVNIRDAARRSAVGRATIAQRSAIRVDVDADRADRPARARSAACCRCSTSATARSAERDEEFVRVLAEQIGRALDYTTLARRRRAARPRRARPLQPRDRPLAGDGARSTR